MILKKILFIFLSAIILYSCTGATDALQGKKRSEQSDEFLVEKKNPLELPPDFGELPMPVDQEEEETLNTEQDNNIKNILDLETNVEENTSGNANNSLEELILEKIN